MLPDGAVPVFPLPLDAYPLMPGAGLFDILRTRAAIDPVNAATAIIFLLAVAHTFVAAWFIDASHRLQDRHDARARARGEVPKPSVGAELLHFLGEVEVVFGLWVVPLMVVIQWTYGWHTLTHYLNDSVNYTEPLFVVVIMALASTRPLVLLAEGLLRRVASFGGGTPGAWWLAILTLGPWLGSLITEPAAMTLSALLLARQFFDLQPSRSLKYATLGLLFVNVSIGGTLTHFAAPPVLMVARIWSWDTPFMLGHFGWRAAIATIVSAGAYYFWYREEFRALAQQHPVRDREAPSEDAPGQAPLLPVPAWVTGMHVAFLAWTVANAHYPALFLGGFLFFLGFSKATAAYQSALDIKTPLLVGFFLAGLVIHGKLQVWWLGPILARLDATGLFAGATFLTAFNDNALITYLASLVPNLDDRLKIAVVAGAVTGGGLTVIANAPNPAGQALLGRFFDDAVHPVSLFLAAAVPTLIAAAAFRLL